VPTSSMALPPREAGVRALTEEFVLMPSMPSQEDGRALAVDVVLTSSMAWPSQEARRTALVAKNFCALTRSAVTPLVSARQPPRVVGSARIG
jgi:hypothetical protein